MNKVITINLNGNAYQLEEAGYDKLHNYLEQAGKQLAGNPDKDEIVGDFEQAIADKCAKYLHEGKTVITAKEIDEILAEMGPVEGDKPDDGKEDRSEDAQAQPTPKRLFKIRQGAVIEGVCNGLAAYFDTDPTIVRVVFIVLTILTGGGWIAAYILMAIFVPEAKTREDIAKAQGKEFNAQTLLNNAHERYEYWKEFGKKQKEIWDKDQKKDFGDSKYWKDWSDKVAAKAVAKADSAAERWSQYPRPGGRFGRGLAGILGAACVLALIGICAAWLIVIFKIFTSGTFLGYFAGAPAWLITVFISCIFFMAYMPFQGMASNFLRYASGRQLITSLCAKIVTWSLWLGALAAIIVILNNSAPMRDGIDNIRQDYNQNHTLGR
jgi:phage shock protein PspC (stress-responsive transcriptional regulator)